MPGLVEPRAHLSFTHFSQSVQMGDIPPEDHAIMTLHNARIMLDQGFTSCNSAAAAKGRLDIAVRDAINRGDFPGPRLLAASPELTVTGDLGDPSLSHIPRENFGYICDGADEFRRAARYFVCEGVDTLKINISGDEGVPWARAHQTVMTDAEVEAVCDVARSRGKRVAAHTRSAACASCPAATTGSLGIRSASTRATSKTSSTCLASSPWRPLLPRAKWAAKSCCAVTNLASSNKAISPIYCGSTPTRCALSVCCASAISCR